MNRITVVSFEKDQGPMAHALLHVSSNKDILELFDRDLNRLNAFKQISASNLAIGEFSALALAPAKAGQAASVAYSLDGKTWIAALGTWLPLPARRGADSQWLLDVYLRYGPVGLSKQLQGIFAIFVGDKTTGNVHVITDRCGSLHVFYRTTPNGHAICTSSAVLSSGSPLDPVAAHEFIAGGIIFEDRTLYRDVRKLPPASVATFFSNGKCSIEQYWMPSEIRAESLDCTEAADTVYSALTRVLRALPETPKPLVSDLTGGYDSRLLLAGLLDAGIPFETTVSGSETLPDVIVAQLIAQAFGIHHGRIAPGHALDGESFLSAVRMADGEYDAFDYARILRVHRELSSKYTMSLNGSFGELARGYWWELLWPKLGSKVPLDVAMVARKRFAALPYDKSIFAGEARFSLENHMAEVLERTRARASELPNTTQLDWIYYTLRMQRWQGRIASSTNQLWQSFSPISFAEVLDPILATKAKGRVGSLLVRVLFERHAPGLASIPLEHGYPPCRITPFNFWRFMPLANYYAEKVWKKLAQRFGRQVVSTTPDSQKAQSLRESNAGLFAECGIDQWLADSRLANTGLFDNNRLQAALDPERSLGGTALEQWRRLVTLEALLRLADSPDST